ANSQQTSSNMDLRFAGSAGAVPMPATRTSYPCSCCDCGGWTAEKSASDGGLAPPACRCRAFACLGGAQRPHCCLVRCRGPRAAHGAEGGCRAATGGRALQAPAWHGRRGGH
ncbi:unnamed protein product, partial [Symbiodinium pilosum]